MAKSRKEVIHQYAIAAFEAAIEGWLRPLERVAQALQEQPDTLQALQSIAEPFSKKKAILDGLVPPETSESVRNFLYLLLQERRLHHLGEILDEFERLARPEKAGPVARIVTAIPLNREEQGALEERLRGRFGAGLQFAYEVDPAILGGVYVQVGDVVIDGSLAGKLQHLRERLVADRL
ncbi:MAG: ATP synthase F1 subunit delta [Anaerolineae bacterium]